MSKEVLERLSKASDLLKEARFEIEKTEVEMYRETGEFLKNMETILEDVWRVTCEVNIMFQDWSLR